MRINQIKKMADDQLECNFAEVQMYASIHIAESLALISESLKLMSSVLQDMEDK